LYLQRFAMQRKSASGKLVFMMVHFDNKPAGLRDMWQREFADAHCFMRG